MWYLLLILSGVGWYVFSNYDVQRHLMFGLSILQNLIIKRVGHCVCFPYVWNGKLYYYPLKIHKGPPKMISKIVSHGENVSKDILPLLGPWMDYTTLSTLTHKDLEYKHPIQLWCHDRLIREL